jgi:hypothetical protein
MSTREDLPLVSLTSQYSSCYYRWATNFLERGRAELRRIPIPRTSVNKGMKKEKKGRDIVAPSSLVLKSTGLWPLKALKAQSQPGATLPILEHFTLPERTSCPIGALAREPLWTGRCN